MGRKRRVNPGVLQTNTINQYYAGSTIHCVYTCFLARGRRFRFHFLRVRILRKLRRKNDLDPDSSSIALSIWFYEKSVTRENLHCQPHV